MMIDDGWLCLMMLDDADDDDDDDDADDDDGGEGVVAFGKGKGELKPEDM